MFQQTKKMIFVNNNNYEADFSSFATCRFSTLTTIFEHLESVGSHKTLVMNRYVCIQTYLYNYITSDLSSSLAV